MHASSQFVSAWPEKSKSRANLMFAFSECKKPLELRWEEKQVTLLSIMCACSELSLGNESSLAESDQPSPPVTLAAEPHSFVTECTEERAKQGR